jgi:hypothetical protein
MLSATLQEGRDEHGIEYFFAGARKKPRLAARLGYDSARRPPGPGRASWPDQATTSPLFSSHRVTATATRWTG